MTPIAQVLIAEDNDIDAERVSRCVKREGLPNPLIRALDGQEALEVLRGQDPRGPLDQPLVVLLDLNMPRMNGLEFLAALREDPELANTRVVVLTTSELPSDRAEAERLNADGYLTKPITCDQLREIIDTTEGKSSSQATACANCGDNKEKHPPARN